MGDFVTNTYVIYMAKFLTERLYMEAECCENQYH